MKMRTVKAIACAAMMALVLSATACGSDDAGKAEDNAAVENTDDAEQGSDEQEVEPEAPADNADTEAEPEAPADSADAADGTASYATLEEYYNDPNVKSVLDATFESLGQEGITLSIDVKGNVFTMTCKFEDSSMINDDVTEALNQGLEANASRFETQAASFDEAVGQSGACTIVVRYTDPDDNVLAEGEFKAQ